MIGFLTPWALIGVVVAGVPLLLHLVQRHSAREVPFPAVRYLRDATDREHRRWRFRDWLLLAIRTLLILALVLAAAGATVRRIRFGPHLPGDLVVIVDNSAASAAVVDGEPLLAQLKRAAQATLAQASPRDRVWLIAADGVARSGTSTELRARTAQLDVMPVVANLAQLIGEARTLFRSDARPAHLVVISGLERPAVRGAPGTPPPVTLRPTAALPPNHGIVAFDAGVQPWTTDGGDLTITVTATDTNPVPLRISEDSRVVRELLVTPGVPTVQRVPAFASGWSTLTATLPPDDFPLDDSRSLGVVVAAPPPVRWDSTDRYLATAMAVLVGDGRIRAGDQVSMGTLGPGPSVVFPPADPSAIGALNRALAARGSGWRFGALETGSARFDSSEVIATRDTVSRWYGVQRATPAGEVLATVAGSPWAVASGDIILVASRLDPAWTSLPLSASFVPFVEALVTRAARGEAAVATIPVGKAMTLPSGVSTIAGDTGSERVAGTSAWASSRPGVFHLLAGRDTLGAISVELDPRASDLHVVSAGDLDRIWPGAIVSDLAHGPSLAFATGSRADLRGALLVLALVCVVAETFIAGRMHQRT